MYNHRKTFSKELYAKHDGPAKVVTKSLLKQMGYEIVDETEAYGSHDFIVSRNGKETRVEVEQKTSWTHDMFPYSTLSVSYRKHTSRADLLFEVNAKGTAVAMCPMSVVLSSQVIRKNTCLGTVNEPFYDVPISMMRFFYLTDGVWYEEEDDSS